MESVKLQVTVKGKRLDVINKVAEATGKRRGAVLGEIVNEVLDSLIPLFEAETEGQAWKAIFRNSLTKMGELLGDEE